MHSFRCDQIWVRFFDKRNCGHTVPIKMGSRNEIKRVDFWLKGVQGLGNVLRSSRKRNTWKRKLLCFEMFVTIFNMENPFNKIKKHSRIEFITFIVQCFSKEYFIVKAMNPLLYNGFSFSKTMEFFHLIVFTLFLQIFAHHKFSFFTLFTTPTPKNHGTLQRI